MNNKCAFCQVDSKTERLEQVTFASPREEMPFKDYKGGYVRYRYLCIACGGKVKTITDLFKVRRY